MYRTFADKSETTSNKATSKEFSQKNNETTLKTNTEMEKQKNGKKLKIFPIVSRKLQLHLAELPRLEEENYRNWDWKTLLPFWDDDDGTVRTVVVMTQQLSWYVKFCLIAMAECQFCGVSPPAKFILELTLSSLNAANEISFN